MIDPSDSRGQVYLQYTGPPGRAGIRYMRLTTHAQLRWELYVLDVISTVMCSV